MDLAALRLAVYEMEWDEDVPTGVAINEAVELAKRFSGEASGSFVNGVLGKIASERRDDEVSLFTQKRNQRKFLKNVYSVRPGQFL